MRASSQKVKRREFRDALRESRSVGMDIYFGGHGNEAVFHAIQNPSRIGIFGDVEFELDKLDSDLSRVPIHFKLPLTQRSTTRDLIESEHGLNADIASKIGNADAAQGMGQRCGLGAIAAAQLCKTRLFQDFKRDLTNTILIQSGGSLLRGDIQVHGSAAGGTTPLAQIVVTSAIVNHLALFLCPFAVTFNVTDSTTFAGLGDWIHMNQACALDQMEKLITAPSIGVANQIIWGLRLLALPPAGRDVVARRENLLLDKQSWSCQQMELYRQLLEPNIAMRCPLGNITHTSTDFFRSLGQADVAGLIATEYFHAVETTLETIYSSPSLIKQIDSNHSIRRGFRNTIEEIVDGCNSQAVEDMIRATMESEGEHVYDLQAINSEGETFDLELISEHFVAVPGSLDDAALNLKTIATIKGVLNSEGVEVKSRINRQEAKIKKAKPKTQRAYSNVQNGRRFLAAKRSAAVRYGIELRRFSDQLAAQKTLLLEIDKSIAALESEYESQYSRLQSISSILETCRQKGRAKEPNNLFYFHGINSAFQDLLTLPSLDHQRRIQVLAAQASQVSVEGMRFILGAKTNTVEALATACIGRAITQGAWPGAIPRPSAKTILVLPPMNMNLCDTLTTQIKSMAPSMLVFMADRCDLGMNVLRFHVYSPECKEDLLPGFLKSEFEKAMSGPTKALHEMPTRNWQLPTCP